MSAVLNFSLGMKKIECCNCHMAFGMTEEFYRERLRLRDSFYCPAGHAQHFTGKTEEEKLREQLASKERALAWEISQRRSAEAESTFRYRQLTATKGVVTKTKKKLARVNNGVCPECQRTFANVARHMITKHGIECNQLPEGSKVRG